MSQYSSTLKTVGIIGGNGWMGSAFGLAAIQTGWLAPEQLYVTSSQSQQRYTAWPQVNVQDDLAQLVKACDVIILSVRPAQFGQVVDQLNAQGVMPDLKNKLVVSLMASLSAEDLQQALGTTAIVRAMPNACAAVQASFTPWYATDTVPAADRTWVQDFLSNAGTGEAVDDEAHIEALTILTGSGPAFPALFLQSLIHCATQYNVPEALAERGAIQNLQGSLKLMAQEGHTPHHLIDEYMHYQGITTEGLKVMQDEGFQNAITAGFNAAYQAAQH